MIVGNVAIAFLMGLPLGTWVFLKYRKLWHQKLPISGEAALRSPEYLE
jgi:hypothetical protein